MAIEINKPNVGLSFKKVSVPKVKDGGKYKEVRGYAYEMFLSDIYDFMVDGFEDTASYFYMDEDLLKEDVNVKEMLDYGVSQGILAVVKIASTGYLYVELLDASTITSLIEYYITEDYREQGVDLVVASEDIKKDITELTTKYVENQVVFLNDLYTLMSNVQGVEATVSLREVVKQPIAISGLVDTKIVAVDGVAIPVYNIPLGMALKLVSIARLSVIGMTANELKNLSVLKSGWFSLDCLDITGSVDALILEGVVKNDSYK